jgi:type IV pilus assembly protein PilA
MGMVKDTEAGFATAVALSLVAFVVSCAAIAVPLLTHHNKSASATVSTTHKTSAVPLLGGEIDKADDAAMKSDLRTVAQEVESQNVDNQNYDATTWRAAAPPVAGSSISGPGQAVGAGTVNVSLGNTITWVGSTASSFCLEATNSKGSTGPWYYSSSGGGLSQLPCAS